MARTIKLFLPKGTGGLMNKSGIGCESSGVCGNGTIYDFLLEVKKAI